MNPGLKDFCNNPEEKEHGVKQITKKISHWERTYDRENNRLGEIMGEELADMTENNAAEQTPGSTGMDY